MNAMNTDAGLSKKYVAFKSPQLSFSLLNLQSSPLQVGHRMNGVLFFEQTSSLYLKKHHKFDNMGRTKPQVRFQLT